MMGCTFKPGAKITTFSLKFLLNIFDHGNILTHCDGSFMFGSRSGTIRSDSLVEVGVSLWTLIASS